jgi:hypothetical protein
VVFDPSNPAEHVGIAAKCIRDGFVIITPHENGYVYLCDAFSEDSVRAMHVLRGDALGVAAQVLIASHVQIEGIARDITDDARALMKAFWPGAHSKTPRCFRQILFLGHSGPCVRARTSPSPSARNIRCLQPQAAFHCKAPSRGP